MAETKAQLNSVTERAKTTLGKQEIDTVIKEVTKQIDGLVTESLKMVETYVKEAQNNLSGLGKQYLKQ